MKPKVLFIHGRPGPHPFHGALAQAVNADFLFVDFRMRWHDKPTSRLHRYLSWLVCALSLPRRRQYDLFLTEGPHFPPVILKQLGLLRGDQRVVALMSDETLYFLKSGQYSRRTQRGLLAALRRFDALICLGDYQTALANELLSGDAQGPRILKAIPGFFDSVAEDLRTVTPRLEGKKLAFIGNGPSGWRGWYKGIDLLLESFALASTHVPGLELDIVGLWDSEYERAKRVEAGLAGDDVRFLGRVPDLGTVLRESALYVHLGRGEAFGASIVEAMLAGVPALVSDQTGAREAVSRVDDRLVIPADPGIASERIRWYLGLEPSEKVRLSRLSRQVAESYTEQESKGAFIKAIEMI